MEEEKRTTETKRDNDRAGSTNTRRQTVRKSQTTSGVVVFQRVIWYIAGVIIVLLLLRIILLLLAANDSNAFVSFIYTVSGFFAAPFYGIFSYEPSYGKSTFEISSVVAIIVYALIAWGIARLSTLSRPREEI